MLAVDDANDESREIVLAGRVEPGHFRRLAADQRAAGFATGPAHAVHELLDHLRLKLAHRQIVQKKQRLGALHEDVVHAVIDEVAANG